MKYENLNIAQETCEQIDRYKDILSKLNNTPVVKLSINDLDKWTFVTVYTNQVCEFDLLTKDYIESLKSEINNRVNFLTTYLNSL